MAENLTLPETSLNWATKRKAQYFNFASVMCLKVAWELFLLLFSLCPCTYCVVGYNKKSFMPEKDKFVCISSTPFCLSWFACSLS